MRDEQLTILGMLQDHTVSADDAARLLAAIGTPNVDDTGIQSILKQVERGELSPEVAVDSLDLQKPAASAQGKWFRIRVQKNGKTPVNIRIPLNLVDTALRLFGGSSMKVDGVPVNTQELWEAVRNSNVGKIIEIDGDDGEHVEISVE